MLRDFLLVYNRMTEICFQRCASNFNYRNLTMDEERCVDNCAGKLIRSNHRLMNTYVQLMPRMVQRRMEEMESKAAENAKAAEAAAAAASGDVGSVTTDASPEFQVPVTAPSLPEVPSSLTMSVPSVGPEIHSSVLTPGLDLPHELDASMSKSTVVQEGQLTAAAPLTPVTETVNPAELSKAINGPSYVAGFPEPPIAVSEIENGSSAALFTHPKPASLSEDVPLSSPILSKLETLSGQEKAPEVPPPSGHQ
uniref:Tim10-like domain-containing protein n=1 Tax=Salarias fasciatus TaxID=181472 RepID=A0A672H9D5_SALFA